MSSPSWPRRDVPGRFGSVCLAAALLFGAVSSVHPHPTVPASFRLASGPYAGSRLYTPPPGPGSGSAQLRVLARIPQAIWLTGGPPSTAVHEVERAVAGPGVPVFVVYDIPHRDCSGHSAGGAASASQYRAYLAAVAGALRGHRAIVVLEPDALMLLDCLSPAQRDARTSLLRWAVGRLSGASVYLDGGVRGAQPPATMARRLAAAGVAQARGFAVNVANYDGTADEIRYGRAVSGHIGWKHFVIDTSRNGVPGRPAHWCNPPGRAVGALPGTPPGDRAVDALLWIKRPGESDGACGASRRPAGQFDPALAQALMRRAGY